jgi:hypothetical protein
MTVQIAWPTLFDPDVLIRIFVWGRRKARNERIFNNIACFCAA